MTEGGWDGVGVLDKEKGTCRVLQLRKINHDAQAMRHARAACRTGAGKPLQPPMQTAKYQAQRPYCVAISNENKRFIESLMDYYTSEAGSYRQIAEQFEPEIESVPDAAFGIIAGCIYTSFLEACRNQQVQPGLEDMTEFNQILKRRAATIKKAIVDPAAAAEAAAEATGSPADAGGKDGSIAQRQAGRTEPGGGKSPPAAGGSATRPSTP